MSLLRASLAVLVAFAAVVGRAEGGVSARVTLHTRVTSLGNQPGNEVLYDRAAQAFVVRNYLVPAEDARYGSAFASVSLEGRVLDGDLRWVVAVDTGELRRTRFHLVAPVCPASTATGIDVVGSGNCVGFPSPVVETRMGDPEATSNGRPLGEELEKTLLVREAYLAWSLGRAGFATARAGRKRIGVGDGFVYDDYATGAELAFDLGAIGPPFDVTLSLFQPTRDAPRSVEGISPLLAIRADWLPSLFEHVGVFLAVHRDRTGSVAELFRGAIVERLVAFLAQEDPGQTAYMDVSRLLARTLARPLESDAAMAWLGTSGRVAPWRGHRFGWTAALMGGRIDRIAADDGTNQILAQDVTLRGRLLSARWEASLGERFGLGAFFLYLSGGNIPLARPPGVATGEYRGFLGIAPFQTATNLFFGGGLSETFAARQATAPGVNGCGVVAPGVTLAFDPADALGFELKAAYLTAPVAGPYGGRVYGTEVDLIASWSPRDWLQIGAELDVLRPGDFYGGTDTVYKTVFAVDLLTP